MASFLDGICPLFCGGDYTLVNTAVFAIAAGLLVIFLVYTFKKYKVEVDKKFVLAVLPWLIAASSSHALDDLVFSQTGVHNPWLLTPLIYFLFFSITFFLIFAGRFLESKKIAPGFEYWMPSFVIGSLACLFNFVNFQPTNLLGFGLVFLFAFINLAGIFLCIRAFNWKFLQGVYFYPLAAHLFDASTTFVSMAFFNYNEQHVLANFFIDLTGTPSAMYSLKLIVLVPILYLIYRKMQGNERNLLLLVIVLLGLGPGLRNLFRLLMGV